MTPTIGQIADLSHLPTLLVIGIAIFGGTIGARLFRRLRIPQVVGYIAVGVLLGRSGLHLIDRGTIDGLLPFDFFALGVIGFMIGRELHRDVFRKHGRQLFIILVSEGVGAFVAVSLLVGGIAAAVTGNLRTSVALGITLGAIASATAPAATVSVLWEYKTRGALTSAVFAIVALDDALALMLYSIASSIATGLMGNSHGGFLATLGHVAYQLVGAAGLGAVVALLLGLLLRRIRDRDTSLAFVIATLALVMGFALWADMDVILAAMALGVTLENLVPGRGRDAFRLAEGFAPPVYVLFFVLAGARLYLGGMPAWMWALVVPYILGRSGGKILGANLGARWSGANAVLRKYLGFCLFSQAGVAVGLSILASIHFAGSIGGAILMIIAVTTFLLEIVGPPFVKFAVKGAGEVGLNVTEEDLINSYKVSDVMNRTAPTFTEKATLGQILHTIAETDAMRYPVADADGEPTGIITIEDLKQSFSSETLADWLVASDLMRPVVKTVTEQTPLAEAMSQMEKENLQCLPVVASGDHPRLVGLLELPGVRRMLSQEVMRRQRQADAQMESSA